jgi:hypothetical protein
MKTCLKCENKILCRGLCGKHYTQAIKLGEISLIQKKQDEFCSIVGCNTETFAKNLCRKHYSRYQKGSPLLKILDKSNWTDVNIAWVAGLIEGEGTFNIRKYKSKKYITIKVVSTDFDVIEKLNSIIGCGRINGPYDRSTPRKKKKPFLVWCLHEITPQIELMNAILPHMGKRRSERIKECLGLINEKDVRNLYI